jgi:hypothetical protein
MDVHQILTELIAERDRLDAAIAALGGRNSTGQKKPSVRISTKNTRRGRRRMTAAGRKRLSELLKKRWASGKMGRRAKSA